MLLALPPEVAVAALPVAQLLTEFRALCGRAIAQRDDSLLRASIRRRIGGSIINDRSVL
jgi:hypothetical protein